jgi:hypothetical protein
MYLNHFKMMNIKIKKSALSFKALTLGLLLGLTTVLPSCKKFLTLEPRYEVSENQAFATVPTTYQFVLGVYRHLAGDAAFGSRLSMIFPYDDDQIVQFLNGTATSDDKRLATYNVIATNTGLSATFTQLYRGIEHANIAIKRIPSMSQYTAGTAEEMFELKRMHGEVLTLRAIYRHRSNHPSIKPNSTCPKQIRT